MRILVIQTGFLGDVVLTTPLISALRAPSNTRDEHRVTVLTTPIGQEVLAGLADEILVLDKRERGGWIATLGLARDLRRRDFDVAIAAHRSHRTALLVRMSGASRRIGFDNAGGRWAYREQVPWQADRHAVERYLSLSLPLGVEFDAVNTRLEMRVDAPAERRVRELLQRSGADLTRSMICIAPGSRWGSKRWRPDGFREVVDALWGDGFQPVLVGSPREAELCGRIAKASRVPVLDLAGRTSVAELAALLSTSSGLLSNDSGPAHVAAAVGCPVAVIFGPTNASLGYAPWGVEARIVETLLDCRPCHRHGPERCPLEHHRCMTEITPTEVRRAVLELVRVSAESSL